MIFSSELEIIKQCVFYFHLICFEIFNFSDMLRQYEQNVEILFSEYC